MSIWSRTTRLSNEDSPPYCRRGISIIFAPLLKIYRRLLKRDKEFDRHCPLVVRRFLFATLNVNETLSVSSCASLRLRQRSFIYRGGSEEAGEASLIGDLFVVFVALVVSVVFAAEAWGKSRAYVSSREINRMATRGRDATLRSVSTAMTLIFPTIRFSQSCAKVTIRRNCWSAKYLPECRCFCIAGFYFCLSCLWGPKSWGLLISNCWNFPSIWRKASKWHF